MFFVLVISLMLTWSKLGVEEMNIYDDMMIYAATCPFAAEAIYPPQCSLAKELLREEHQSVSTSDTWRAMWALTGVDDTCRPEGTLL